MSDFTKEDWWKLVDDHWYSYLETFELCGAPLDSCFWNEGGELVEHDLTMERTLFRAKMERDHKTIYDLFSKCWAAAPDRSYIHTWPAWDHLCDVCSEYPVAFV